jgi:ribosomal protein S18 acetylase RimI-like enzyme
MPKPMPEITIAGSGDSSLLAELTAYTFRESWLEEGNENDLEIYVNEYFTADRMALEVNNPDISYMILWVEGAAAAYCKLERNISPDGHDLSRPICISRLYVRKEFQNKNLGSLLIDEALHRASTEKFQTMWLGVWYKNPSAIRLYERFGFQKFGTYQFVMGNEISDDFLMKRKI